ESTRRGNTHEFFCPVSVYRTRNGHVYLAIGNDRQWRSMVSKEIFASLDKPEYEKNQGRIQDGVNLNRTVDEITKKYTSEELIDLFNAIRVPISKIKNISEVTRDPLVERRILFATDPVTKTRITMAPPPNMTPFLEMSQRQLSFPPRFGEHNQEIYGECLGYPDEELSMLKREGIV
ncbi:MAG: CoA transferase, partial [bacterium]|nr:CoA transferase [bacterium]